MATVDLNEFLTIRDVAKRTRYSRTWVRKVIVEHGLTCHRYHGRTFIDPETVERLVQFLPPREPK